jgi:predicted permease
MAAFSRENTGMYSVLAVNAARSIRRAPWIHTAIVATLALGVGANAAVAALLDRAMLRPPSGVTDPQTLRRLYVRSKAHPPGVPDERNAVNYPEFLDLQRSVGSAALLAGYAVDTVALTYRAISAPTVAAYVSSAYFATVGVRVARGRAIARDENVIDHAAPVAVLSDAVWRMRFGADPSILGKRVLVDERAYTIVGVAPPDFSGVDLSSVDVWLPLGTMHFAGRDGQEWAHRRGAYLLRPIMRIGPAIPARAIAARATVVFRKGPIIGGAGPDATATIVAGSLVTARDAGRGGAEIAIATRLALVSLLLLLVACANVANLLLVRAAGRSREHAVRIALGVERRWIIGALTAEGAILGFLGGIVGAILSLWAWRGLATVLFPGVHSAAAPIDWALEVTVVLVGVGAGTLASVPAAIRAARIDPSATLRSAGRGLQTGPSRLREGLVTIQGALSVILLAGAGLFVQSWHRAATVSLGYDAANLVVATVTWPTGSSRAADYSVLLPVVTRLGELPGVDAVGLSSAVPMRRVTLVSLFTSGDSALVPPMGAPTVTAVSASYFAASGLHAVRGRVFRAAHDGADDARSVVVSQSLAKWAWPDRNPIGQCLRLVTSGSPCNYVAGVVSDVKRRHVTDPPDMSAYVSFAQPELPAAIGPSAVVVRTRSDVPFDLGALRTEMPRNLSANVHIERMADYIAAELRPWRLGTELFGFISALALLVAAFGTYGVVAYDANLRASELALRLALGASRASVLELVVRRGVTLAAVGAVAGLVGVLAAGRVVASLMFATSAHDPLVLGTAVSLVCIVGALASAIPGWRAAHLDPATALRD